MNIINKDKSNLFLKVKKNNNNKMRRRKKSIGLKL